MVQTNTFNSEDVKHSIWPLCPLIADCVIVLLVSAVILWWPRPCPGAEEPHSHICRHAPGWLESAHPALSTALWPLSVRQRKIDCRFVCFYLQGYGFLVSRLFDLLFEVRDQYNETLLKKWSLVFRSAVVIFTCVNCTTCGFLPAKDSHW